MSKSGDEPAEVKKGGDDTAVPTSDAGSPTARRAGKPPAKQAGSTHFPMNAGCVINPRNKFMKKWDIVMLLLLLYTAVVTPYEVAFLATEWNFLFVLNRFVDALFFMDLIMNFFMASLDLERGFWVVEHKEIAARYLRSWFTLDLVSILPFDSVELSGAADVGKLKIFRVVRLFRLLKLFRIFRASRIFSRWEAYISVSYAWLSLIKFIVAVLSVSHWLACFWGLTPGIEDFVGNDGVAKNWILNYDHVDTEDGVDLYLTSLYWSVMTLTTIGYGDVSPVTPGERVLAILAMMMGGSIYAYVVGAVCGIVASMDEATTLYHKTMDELNVYMEENKLGPSLRRRLREYFNNCRSLQRARHYRDLLTKMSPMLRGEVATVVNGGWVETLPFLAGVPEEEREGIATEIALRLEIEAFAPNETIVKVGQVADKMYIVQRGVVSMSGRVYRSGDILGDDMILKNNVRNYAVRSLTFVAMSTLSKEDFDEIINSGIFPNSKRIVRRSAIRMCLRREFIHYANSIIALQSVIPSFNGKAPSEVRRVLQESRNLSVPGQDKLSPMLAKPLARNESAKSLAELRYRASSGADGAAAPGVTHLAPSDGGDGAAASGAAASTGSAKGSAPAEAAVAIAGSEDDDAAPGGGLGPTSPTAGSSPLIIGPGSRRIKSGGDGDSGAGAPSKRVSQGGGPGGSFMDSELKRVIADAERELGLPTDMPDLDDLDYDLPGAVSADTGGGLGGSSRLGSNGKVSTGPVGRFTLAGGSPGLGAPARNVDIDEHGKYAKLAAARHKSVEASINATRAALAGRVEDIGSRVRELEDALEGVHDKLKQGMSLSTPVLAALGGTALVQVILLFVLVGNTS